MIGIGCIIGIVITLWIINRGMKAQQKVKAQTHTVLVSTEQYVFGNIIADEATRRADIYLDFIQKNLAEQGLDHSQVNAIINRLDEIVLSKK